MTSTSPALDSGAAAEPQPAPARRIRLWHFFALVIVYVVTAQVLTLVGSTSAGGGDGALDTVDNIVIRVVVPVGIASILAIAYVTWTRAWQSIFVERHRLTRAALVIPALLFALAIGITNYAGLGEKGFVVTGVLFVAVMLVGFGEELVFRGVGVQAFRQHGCREWTVALWTSVIFGVSHGTNAVVTGEIVDALVQIVLTTGTGFVFYLVMRGTGALAMAMLFHGLWDFGALSTQVDPANPSPLVNLAAVALAVILVGVLIFRRRLGLTPAVSADAQE